MHNRLKQLHYEDAMGNKRQIFISYSHNDREWLDRLKPFLRPLQRAAELQVWSDDEDLEAGSLWRSR